MRPSRPTGSATRSAGPAESRGEAAARRAVKARRRGGGPLDGLVLVACVGTAAFLLWSFWQDLSSSGSKAGEEPVGTIVFKQRTAQRRFSGRAVWENLEARSPVYNLDAIRTERDSEALVRLADGTELSLQENSLVVLSFEGSEKRLDFVSGSLVARAVSGPGGLTIRSGGSELVMGKAAVDLRKDDRGGLALAVDSGEVRVKAAGGETRVGADQVARLDSGSTRVQAAPPSPLSPASGSRIASFEPRPAVDFGFRRNGLEGPVLVELSRSRDFARVAASARSEGDGASLALDPGTWWWRVRPAAGGGPEPRLASFTIGAELQAEPLSPAEGASFAYRAKPPQVRLAWSGAEGALDFAWEVSADPSFSVLAASGRAVGSPALVEGLEAGRYYWRVRPSYPGAVIGSGDSRPRAFSVARLERIEAVELLSPAEGRSILAPELGREGLLLAWRGSEGAERYILQIAEDRAFTKVAAAEAVDSTSLRLKPDFSPGRYFWRVTAVDGAGTASAPSASRGFEVVAGEVGLALERPAEGYAFAPGESGPILAWKSIGNPRVELKVIRLPKGETILARSVEERSLALPPLPPGDYRWSAAPSGRPDKTVSRDFSVADPPPPPAAGEPSGQARISLVNTRTIRFGWAPSPRAEFYRFELRGPGGDRLLAAETSEPGLSFAAPPAAALGEYSWSVSAGRPATEDSAALLGPAARFSFRLASIRETGPAQPRLPAAGAVLPGLEARRGGVEFRWRAPEPGTRSRVVVASDSEFAQRVTEIDSAGESAVSGRIDPGSYFWRVESRTAEGVGLPASPARPFSVSPIAPLPRPSVLLPAAGAVVDMRGADSIRFAWTGVPGATDYRLALALAKNGKVVWSAARVAATEYRFAKLDALDIGDLVLTVRAESYDGSGELERPGAPAELRFAVTLGPPPASPALITPRTIYVP